MRFSVFKQAAAEACARMKEIDAEIDRLTAKRELLGLLESTASEILTVVPITARAIQAGEDLALRPSPERCVIANQSDPLTRKIPA